ncbi:hypothetical protein [Plasmodium yoelii yoelii]|uniref:Uncharacterized protein n=1 Tax=Plasmodium yoelii yoelii TaxID=73239 RepID=Q7RBZ6_PLAYO|nr:hypothetical protein [Plasmodium yoelii yoelii]
MNSDYFRNSNNDLYILRKCLLGNNFYIVFMLWNPYSDM